jgi:hypothetical protein
VASSGQYGPTHRQTEPRIAHLPSPGHHEAGACEASGEQTTNLQRGQAFASGGRSGLSGGRSAPGSAAARRVRSPPGVSGGAVRPRATRRRRCHSVRGTRRAARGRVGPRVFQSRLQGDHPRQAREIEHPANGRSARHHETQLPSPRPQPLRQPEQQCHTGAVEVGDVAEVHHQPARLLPHGNTDL